MRRSLFNYRQRRKFNLATKLVFLPGTLCDERLWGATIRALSNRWQCVPVDYGFEDSISAMATKALVENAGSIIPIGLSMGGMVALEMWRQAPERVVAMALFDTDCGADTSERRIKRDAQILKAVHGDFRRMVETQLAPAYFSNTAVIDSGTLNTSGAAPRPLHDLILEMALDLGVATFAAQITALATRSDLWRQIEKINVPTFVACGVDDKICPPELHRKMAALIPLAKFISIPGASHLPPLEQPDVTTFALRSWLHNLDI